MAEITLTKEQFELYKKYRALKKDRTLRAQIDQLTDLEASVKSFLGDKIDGKEMLSPTGKVLARCQQVGRGGMTFDLEAFKKHHVALFNEYNTKVRSAAFSIKFLEW